MSSESLNWDKVIMHIGLPRCASTYLQEVIFPSLPVDIFDSWGTDKAQLNNEVYNPIKTENFDKDFFIRWIDEKTTKKSDTLLISQETLGWGSTWKITANNLHGCFPNAEILIIIREQYSFLASNYCFKVTTGCFHETRTLDEFLTFFDVNNHYELLEYDKLISYYQELFGREKVHVVPVEMLQRDPELFQKSILDIFNLNNEITLKNSGGVVNKSIRGEKTVSAMLRLNKIFSSIYSIFNKINPSLYWDNKFLYGYYHLKSPIANIIGGILENDQSRLVEINNLEMKELNERFAKSNGLLKKLINIPLEKYGYQL